MNSVSKSNQPGDFAGGPVAETPSSSAEGRGLILGWGAKIPHATEQLIFCATTVKAQVAPTKSPLCCNQDPEQRKIPPNNKEPPKLKSYILSEP